MMSHEMIDERTHERAVWDRQWQAGARRYLRHVDEV